MGKYLIAGLLTLTLAGAALLAWALGGFYDVAADRPQPAAVTWLLHSTYDAAVERRADHVPEPPDLTREEHILSGARSYLEMCSGCHIPPGQSDTPVAQGLDPAPPGLTDLGTARAPREAFWVIDHGVRMTGMPAFGPTHDDADLWALVAFVNRMAGASPETYLAVVSRARREAPADDGHNHRHGGGDMGAGPESDDGHGDHRH